MTRQQRADRLLRDAGWWQMGQERPRAEEFTHGWLRWACDEFLCSIFAGESLWEVETRVCSSLANSEACRLGFDLDGTEKVAYLTAAGWTAWPPLPPAPPPTLTESEKRAKAAGKEPTREQREKWDKTHGNWPKARTNG